MIGVEFARPDLKSVLKFLPGVPLAWAGLPRGEDSQGFNGALKQVYSPGTDLSTDMQ
jgi:hypothetical protein